MFQSLGRFVARRAWWVCALWLALGGALAWTAPTWDSRAQDDDVRFLPPRFTSVRAYHLIEKAFPNDIYACRLVYAIEREGTPLTDADFAAVDRIAARLEALRQEAPELKLGKIDSYRDPVLGSRLTSADRGCTLIQVSLGTPYLALATVNAVGRIKQTVGDLLASHPHPGLQVYATGAAGLGHDLIQACGDSLDGTTWATVLLVVVVLLVVYRAPFLALIPLVTIGVSVWVSLNLLALMTLLPGVHLVNISKIFSIVILYGAGTDYCVFLVSRYREELKTGYNLRAALTRSVGGVGEALAASAGTVMVGLGMMALAEFAKVRYSGPAIAICLGVALLASLTLTPALLRVFGTLAFWPGKPPQAKPMQLASANPSQDLWGRISDFVAARPITVGLSASALLLPLVILGFQARPNYCLTSELSPKTESLRGLASIQRHFTAGEIGPVTVVLASPRDWASVDGRFDLERLSRGLAHLPGIAEVRSLTQPMGMPLPTLVPDLERDSLLDRLLLALQPTLDEVFQEIHANARQHYLSAIVADDGSTRSVTRLDVVLKTDPFSPESAQALRAIELWCKRELPQLSALGGPLDAECFGVTATSLDLASVTESDRMRVNTLVAGAIALILLALVRRVWLSVYLLVTVLASYYASLGATVLAGLLWTGQMLPHVDWRVPFFLFVILVAVGEDYNILLISRALEERKRFGAYEGMRRALARTGGAITSCGLIMAGTFATLMLAGLNTLTQIGFALAFGVLIDTFVVRPFLVPACAFLFWTDEPRTHHRPATQARPHRRSA